MSPALLMKPGPPMRTGVGTGLRQVPVMPRGTEKKRQVTSEGPWRCPASRGRQRPTKLQEGLQELKVSVGVSELQVWSSQSDA